MSAVLAALSDPLHREVIARMALLPDGAERNCASLGFPVAKASLAYHFRVLREAGLIHRIDYGNRRTSLLRRADLDMRFPGLLQMLRTELGVGDLASGAAPVTGKGRSV